MIGAQLKISNCSWKSSAKPRPKDFKDVFRTSLAVARWIPCPYCIRIAKQSFLSSKCIRRLIDIKRLEFPAQSSISSFFFVTHLILLSRPNRLSGNHIYFRSLLTSSPYNCGFSIVYSFAMFFWANLVLVGLGCSVAAQYLASTTVSHYFDFTSWQVPNQI